MSENYIVPKIIDYVQGKIEVCIQKYMSLEETITNLEENHQIHRLISTAIWKKLQSENPNFFKEYFKRCELARQIAKFNDLLSQQIDLMHNFGQINLSTTAPDEFDEWIRCNGFADLEETVSSIIDSSPFAATPHSDPFTSFVATPQSDPFTPGPTYGIDLDECFLQFCKETEEQQLRLELRVQKQHKPQHLLNNLRFW